MFTVPILRSRYSLNQYRRILQTIAHNIAKHAVESLHGNVAVKAEDGKLIHVSAEDFWIRFNRKSIIYWDAKKGVYIAIEDKPYEDGNQTKITFQDERRKEVVEKFLADLMKGVKPESEFSLKKFTQKQG